MSLKILHVLDHSIPLHSGYAFRTRAILEQQRALGWQTFHITSAKHTRALGSTAPIEVIDGWQFYRTAEEGLFDRVPILNQWDVVQGLVRRIRTVVEETRPDILHAHSPALNGLAALRVGRQLSIPVVYEIRAFWEDAAVDHGTSTPRGLRYRLTRGLETHVVRRADAVTTICQGLHDDLLARGVDAERLTVIPNAVDVERFAQPVELDALRQHLGLAGKRVIGFLGSFYAYEGLDLLIAAMPAVLHELPDVHLLLVGGGPEAHALRQQVMTLGLESAVSFIGRVPHDAIHEYYGLIELFAYPRHSLRLTELVTPLKPLEAMAQGGLVLASDVGGHRELIRHDVTGVLFPAEDASALARACIDLLNDAQRAQRLRVAGQSFVKLERSWSASVARYRDVYKRVCPHAEQSP